MLLGLKAGGGGCKSDKEKVGVNRMVALETGRLEFSRGKWNAWCSGEMLRYKEEHRLRRRLAGL